MDHPTTQALDELDLFKTNHQAWMDLASPRIAARVDTMDDKQLDSCWQTMSKSLRRRVWMLLEETQKARVRMVRPGDAQAGAKAA